MPDQLLRAARISHAASRLPSRVLRLGAWACVVLWMGCSGLAHARDAQVDRSVEHLRKGHALYRIAALTEAAQAYRTILRSAPCHSPAHIGLAQVQIAQGRAHEALAHLALARVGAATSSVATIHRLRAHALLLLDRTDAAEDAADAGLRIDPLDADLVEVRAQTAYRQGQFDRASQLYFRAARMDATLESSNLRLGSGFGPVFIATPWRHAPQRAPFQAAVAAWRTGALAKARDRFAALATRWPLCFKYRLGLGLCIREQRLAQNAGCNDRARFRVLPMPRIPHIAALIPQWHTLDEESQHVVAWSVAPGARWVSTIVESRGRHDILDWDVLLTDAPERSKFTRTFDGRRWRQMRGIGGRIAATGVEKLRLAAAFSFNTFAHEFAHQLLTYGFDPALQRQVKSLYLDALEHGRCLDYYAASNVDEYFAQGYEAFVSLHKNRRLRITAKHTRAELERRDPPLFAFLAKHLDRTHEAGNALDAFKRYGKR